MTRSIVDRISLVAVSLLAFASTVDAMPRITGQLTVLENRALDDPFPGLHLVTRVDATHRDGAAAFTSAPGGATVRARNREFPFPPDPHPLEFHPAGFVAGMAFVRLFPIRADDIARLAGDYIYDVTDRDGETDSIRSHRLDKLAVIPHPTELALGDTDADGGLVFTFTDPEPMPSFAGLARFYQLVVFDPSGAEIAILPSPTSAETTPRIVVPAGVLHPGGTYVLRAQSLDIDTTQDFAIQSISASLLRVGGPARFRFVRGDCSGDGQVSGQVTDAVFVLDFNFLGGRSPPCLAACDANGDGRVTGAVTDAVWLLSFNFLGGPPPPEPFPGCGFETPADRALGCETPPESCSAAP